MRTLYLDDLETDGMSPNFYLPKVAERVVMEVWLHEMNELVTS